MDGFKSIVLIVSIASAFYFVRNIKISVTDAAATEVVELAPDADSQPAGDMSDGNNPTSESSRPSRQPQSFNREVAVDPLQQLVAFIQARQLCEFLEFADQHSLGKKDQLRALGMSLGDEKFSELSVFIDSDFSQFHSYKTKAAKGFLLAQNREAFANMSFTGGDDFVKGLKPEHKTILEMIEVEASRDSDNLFYAMLRNDIFHRYSNVDDATKAKLYDQVMATTYYENPVQSLFRDLYQQSKSNVVQFYLAQSIFYKQSVGLDENFIGRNIWRFYDEGMRYYINGLLGKSLENVSDSAKVFAYETGVYKAYRNSLHYLEYEASMDVGAYDASKSQPTYGQEELRLSFEGACDPVQVSELEIKLRAL